MVTGRGTRITERRAGARDLDAMTTGIRTRREEAAAETVRECATGTGTGVAGTGIGIVTGRRIGTGIGIGAGVIDTTTENESAVEGEGSLTEGIAIRGWEGAWIAI